MEHTSLYEVRMQDRKLVIFDKEESNKDSIILAMNKDFIVSLELVDFGLEVVCKYDNNTCKRFTLIISNETQSRELLSTIHKTRIEYAKLMRLKLRILDDDGSIKEIPLKSIQTLDMAIESEDGDEVYCVVIGSTTEGSIKYSYLDEDSARKFYESIDNIFVKWSEKINDFSLCEGFILQSQLHINT